MALLPPPPSDSHLGIFAVSTNYQRVLVHKLKDPLTKSFNTLSLLNLEYMNLSDTYLVLTATMQLLNYSGLF